MAIWAFGKVWCEILEIWSEVIINHHVL
jgi:hypothetical protein